MALVDTKSQILDEAGYSYSFDRMIYVNRPARKVFSMEFVDDNTEENLQRCIDEEPTADGWHFYFTSPPSDEIRHDLENALG
jgi:hypothetical protein